MTDTSSRNHARRASALGCRDEPKPLLSELVAGKTLAGPRAQYRIGLDDTNLCRAVVGNRNKSDGVLPKLRGRLCVAQPDVLND